jgi:hypothetical protein
MTTLLDMVRQRRVELTQELEPITDEDCVRVLMGWIEQAPHYPDATEKLRKACAIGPQVADVIKKLAARMLEELKARVEPEFMSEFMSLKILRRRTETGLQIIQRHGFIPEER